MLRSPTNAGLSSFCRFWIGLLEARGPFLDAASSATRDERREDSISADEEEAVSFAAMAATAAFFVVCSSFAKYVTGCVASDGLLVSGFGFGVAKDAADAIFCFNLAM